MKRKTVSKPITLTYLHYTGVERGERKKETDMKEDSMRKSYISLSLSLLRLRREIHVISVRWRRMLPLRVLCRRGRASRLDRSLSSPCVYWRKKKDISIDLRAPTPPTLFDVDDASNSNFFFLVYKRKKK